jgi:3-hydroxyacyl-[acyl-carrier-protein] dehydratase
MIVAQFQGVVDGQIVCEGELKGIPIPVDYVKNQLAKLGA